MGRLVSQEDVIIRVAVVEYIIIIVIHFDRYAAELVVGSEVKLHLVVSTYFPSEARVNEYL